MHLKGFATALLLLLPVCVFAGEGKFSGELFGDVYWIADNHDSALVDMNGTWMRRMNLTYDYKFDESLSSRVRFEAASPGDFTSNATMLTYMKDVWIKYQSGNYAVIAGLSPTPTLSMVEEVWGYRAIEKVPAELQRLATSRDMGLSFNGAIGEDKRVTYQFMGGNGSALQGETDSKKKIMGALRFWLTSQVVVEGYGDYEDRTNSGDRQTYHGLVGYKADRLRAGVQYVQQNRDEVGEDVELRIASGFIAGAANDKLWLFARVDRNLDPNPDGDSIAYIPFDPSAANTFILAGVDYRLADMVSLSPNVEVVVYDEPDAGGPTPDTDVIPRVTFSCKF
jgi:hypothetical protein